MRDDLREDRLKLLYVAPERLVTAGFQQMLQDAHISLFAIDEAHCVSPMGPRLPPRISRALGHRRELPRRAAHGADRHGRSRDARRHHRAAWPARMRQCSPPASTGRTSPTPSCSGRRAREQLLDFLSTRRGESGIVYCLSRKKVEETADVAERAGRARAALSCRHGCAAPGRATRMPSSRRTAW